MSEKQEVVDVELTAFIHQSRAATSGIEQIANEWARDNLEERFMAKLDEFAGDGEAAVTVSGALAHNDFGNKAEAFVAVKVPCGATTDNILGAHGVAREIVESLVRENLDRMEAILGIPLTGGGDATAKVAEPAVPAEQPAKKAVAKKKITIKKGAKKTGPKPPNFQR
jgi:hypothetical protein